MNSEQRDEAFEQMRRYRDEHFGVRVMRVRKDDQLYPDEVRLEVTYNGRQWYPLALNRKEATTLRDLLTAYLSESPEDGS